MTVKNALGILVLAGVIALSGHPVAMAAVSATSMSNVKGNPSIGSVHGAIAARIKALNPHIETVSHVDHPASPHMVIVLERDGWEGADSLHAYATSIREILARAVKSGLLPDGTQVTFVMTLPHPASPPGSASAPSNRNVLRLQVSHDQIPIFLADTERPVVSALFRYAQVEFSGRYGVML